MHWRSCAELLCQLNARMTQLAGGCNLSEAAWYILQEEQEAASDACGKVAQYEQAFWQMAFEG